MYIGFRVILWDVATERKEGMEKKKEPTVSGFGLRNGTANGILYHLHYIQFTMGSHGEPVFPPLLNQDWGLAGFGFRAALHLTEGVGYSWAQG